jgi:hypothetical protein
LGTAPIFIAPASADPEFDISSPIHPMNRRHKGTNPQIGAAFQEIARQAAAVGDA